MSIIDSYLHFCLPSGGVYACEGAGGLSLYTAGSAPGALTNPSSLFNHVSFTVTCDGAPVSASRSNDALIVLSSGMRADPGLHVLNYSDASNSGSRSYVVAASGAGTIWDKPPAVVVAIFSTSGGSPDASPAHGPLSGGTPFTIHGCGFLSLVTGPEIKVGTDTVSFDATDVIVVDDATITTVSPASVPPVGLQNVYLISDVNLTLHDGFDYEIMMRLLQVSFDGGRDLRFDDDSGDYVAPHWTPEEETS